MSFIYLLFFYVTVPVCWIKLVYVYVYVQWDVVFNGIGIELSQTGLKGKEDHDLVILKL